MKKSQNWRYVPLLLALLLLGGCTLSRFEPMEEAQQKEEDKNRLMVQAAEVSPESMTADDLVFERVMKSDSGVVLASYEARVPQFVEDGAKSGVFQNINAFYKQEFEAFAADCEWVFLTLQKELGAGWNNIVEERQAVTSVFDYETQTVDGRYLSVVRDYVYTDSAGRSTVHYYAELFDLSTGWKLKFADLFGKNAAEAQAAVIDELAAWCEKNGLAFDTRESIAADQLLAEFTLQENELVLCLEPFALSADDAEGRVAHLPLSAFAGWMKE